MAILIANVSDAPEILKLQRAAYQSEAKLHNDFKILPLTQTLEALEADFATKTFLKVVDEERLIASGQVLYENGTCYIGRLAVWPEWQGKGIGSKLLLALENIYPEALRFELFTGAKSASNLAMYKRRGYSEFKRSKVGKTTLVFLERVVHV
jgi:GNAT superfamily N-acetyltransferase